MSAIAPENIHKNSTNTAFLSALVVNFSLLVVEVGTFTILKSRLWRIYTPRTILPPPDKRAEKLPPGVWRWIPALLMSSPEDIIHKNGLDAYMFLRFIKLLMIIFTVFTIMTFLFIVPANSVRIVSNMSGLDRISWSNITDPKDQMRFAAHVVIVYLLTAFVLYIIRREMLHFMHTRHQFLLSKSYSRLPQARTVLITPVPEELASERDLRKFASFVPGGIDKIWMYRDTGALNHLFERRQEAREKLEAAEAAMLKMAMVSWGKKEHQYKKIQKRKLKDVEHRHEQVKLAPPRGPASREFLDDLVAPNLRPKHSSGMMGLFGSKVDTIDWCKDEISRLNKEIKESRDHIVEGKFLGSIFIRCNLQMGAHILSQCLSYHEPLWMYNKWIDAHPKDIVWRNLDDGALEMKSRYILSWLATAGLIFVWAFPVGFVGALSNLTDLCVKFHWLEWVCRAPTFAQGLIEGVLPPLLLAIMFALLPFILRALAWYECIPRYSLISVSVYRRFYLFILIHGFLIVTLTSGITNAIEEIVKNPTQTVQELSSRLPGASVFFLTYMITQGLAGAGSALVQLLPLVLHFLRKWFLGRTPRQAYDIVLILLIKKIIITHFPFLGYKVTFKMPAADFGVVLPRLSLLATITPAYSVLSPLINLLALISLILASMEVLAKFSLKVLTQVFDRPDELGTGGMYFPMAINNLFVGLYIQQICLGCLFFLKVHDAGIAAVVQAVFMILLLVLTACAQRLLDNSFASLERFLPISLATKKMAQRYSRDKKETTDAEEEDGEFDLFSRDRIRSARRRIKGTKKRLGGKLEELKAKVKGDNDKDNDSDNPAEEKDARTVKFQAEGPTGESTTVSSSAYLPEADFAGETRDDPEASKDKSETKHKLPVFDAAAPVVHDSDEEDGDDHTFDHPSSYVDQAWIWLPKDPLGLSEFLVKDLKAVGIDASDVGANMDENGIVEVTRNPPDEEWGGGRDA